MLAPSLPELRWVLRLYTRPSIADRRGHSIDRSLLRELPLLAVVSGHALTEATTARNPAIWILQIGLGLAYPFLIWSGLSRFEPRQLGLVVLVFFGLRFALQRPARAVAAVRTLWLPTVSIGLIIAAVLFWNDPIGLLLMPVAISLGFLATFLVSLRTPLPMIERFARLQVDTLSPEEIEYCRRVTWIWCAFFTVNASIAAALAASRRLDAWAFYTGFASYLLMGTLFAAEYVYRHARFRRYVGGFADPLLKRFFPPTELRPNASGQPHSAMPPITLSRTTLDGRRRVEWQVPEHLDCWPGHFPEQFLVPGVLQLEWILREIESEIGHANLDLIRIDRLKFKKPICPGDRLSLEFWEEEDSAGNAFRIELRIRNEVATTARILANCRQRPTVDPVSFPSTAEQPEATRTWPEPAMVLPHRAPMLWIRSIVSHDQEETCCLVSPDDLGEFSSARGEAGAWVALEWMAQCVAAHDGVERQRRGLAIRPGMLLGTKRLEIDAGPFKRGETFYVTTRRIFGGDTGMVAYDCEVTEAGTGRKRATARLSCRVGMPGAPLVETPDGPGRSPTAES